MKSRKLKYFVPAVFLSALSGATPSYAQVNAEQVMNIGRNVLSMEDYLLSIQYFNQAIKAKPYLADAYFYRGLAKLSLDDYDGAIADCNLALERNKFKSEAYKVRGFAYMNIGKDSLAIADFNKGLEYNPDDRYFLFYKGIAQSELKKYESADSTFSYLLRRHPNFEDGYLAAGRMDLQRGDTITGGIFTNTLKKSWARFQQHATKKLSPKCYNSTSSFSRKRSKNSQVLISIKSSRGIRFCLRAGSIPLQK